MSLWKPRWFNCRWDTEMLMKEKHSLREQGANYGGFLIFFQWKMRSLLTARWLSGIDWGFIRLPSCSVGDFWSEKNVWDACPNAEWESKPLINKASAIFSEVNLALVRSWNVSFCLWKLFSCPALLMRPRARASKIMELDKGKGSMELLVHLAFLSSLEQGCFLTLY